MFRTRSIPALFLSLIAGTAAAQPVSFTVTVDGLQNCLETSGTPGIPSFVQLEVPAGTYRAQVLSSTIYRDPNTPGIDSTIGMISGYSSLPSFSLDKSLRFTTGGDLKFFFIDSLCVDNGGSAMVRLTKLN